MCKFISRYLRCVPHRFPRGDFPLFFPILPFMGESLWLRHNKRVALNRRGMLCPFWLMLSCDSRDLVGLSNRKHCQVCGVFITIMQIQLYLWNTLLRSLSPISPSFPLTKLLSSWRWGKYDELLSNTHSWASSFPLAEAMVEYAFCCSNKFFSHHVEVFISFVVGPTLGARHTGFCVNWLPGLLATSTPSNQLCLNNSTYYLYVTPQLVLILYSHFSL